MSQVEVYLADPALIDTEQSRAVLRGDEAHHLLRVRRARPGDELMLIDGIGTAWPGKVMEVDREEATISIGAALPQWNEPPIHVHLGLGLLKSDHFSEAVNLAVQAGVGSITPLDTRYSIAGWSSNKQGRAERLAITAAKQCGRGAVPPLHPVQPLQEWCIQGNDIRHRILLDAEGGPLPRLQQNDRIALAIGPEGGFHEDEIAMLQSAGFTRVRLGRRRLRSETAVAVGVAQLVLSVE